MHPTIVVDAPTVSPAAPLPNRHNNKEAETCVADTDAQQPDSDLVVMFDHCERQLLQEFACDTKNNHSHDGDVESTDSTLLLDEEDDNASGRSSSSSFSSTLWPTSAEDTTLKLGKESSNHHDNDIDNAASFLNDLLDISDEEIENIVVKEPNNETLPHMNAIAYHYAAAAAAADDNAITNGSTENDMNGFRCENFKIC